MKDILTLAAFAQEIVREAGFYTKQFFGKSLDVSRKQDNSPVTQADIGAESLLRSRIEATYPHHGILGEELGNKPSEPRSEYLWILDPIDGTKSFIRGIPLYTTLVAVLRSDEPVIGIIYNPMLDELTLGIQGFPTRLNGQVIQVSKTSHLSEAWLQVTDPSDLLRRHRDRGSRLIQSVLATRTWADGHGYAMVARGESDIMLDPIMNIWDLACLKPIIEGAGGIFTDLQGNHGMGTSALATNQLLHPQILELFSE